MKLSSNQFIFAVIKLRPIINNGKGKVTPAQNMNDGKHGMCRDGTIISGVIITILCDLCQFSANNFAFLSKTNVMINFFEKSNSTLKKRQYLIWNILANFLAKTFSKS
jgi:hypothetical protein